MGAAQDSHTQPDSPAPAQADLTTMSELQLYDHKQPWPKTREELHAVIDQLADRKHDYGTCVYAMSIAAEATFNYIAHKLFVTGFQASCADLDIIRRTRRMNGPFVLVDSEKMLYPQYNLLGELSEWMNRSDIRKWLRDEAKKRLAESDGLASKEVLARWNQLAAYVAPDETEAAARKGGVA